MSLESQRKLYYINIQEAMSYVDQLEMNILRKFEIWAYWSQGL